MTTPTVVDTQQDDDPARMHVDVVLPDDIRAFLWDYRKRPAEIQRLVYLYEVCVGMGVITP